MVKAVGKRVRGAPEPGAPAPATGHPPRIPFLIAFTVDFLRFEGHFGCSVWVLGGDGFWGRVWCGLRTILPSSLGFVKFAERVGKFGTKENNEDHSCKYRK